MTTRLDKILKRELTVDGRAFIVALSPEGLKITRKGARNGQELRWTDLVSGDAALAIALNASVGKFAPTPPAAQAPRTRLKSEAAPSPKRRRRFGRAGSKRR